MIAGLSHDHVTRMLQKGNSGEIIIAGIAEPDQALCKRMKTSYQLPDSIFYTSLAAALKKNNPDLVMVYNAPADHLSAVQTCMPLKIPVMLEKPFSYSYTDAVKMKALSDKYQTKIYTNYPSLWYTSFMELLKRANDKKELGSITKMEMHGGHAGPAEIGCSKDFLNWLTSPVKNGGGAITDFGCYGASIMTELMQGKTPVSVYAGTRHTKPAVYPKVDDDATIILEYAGATGIIEASWNWPYTMMDAEAYGSKGYLYASQFNANGENPSLQFKNEKGINIAEITQPVYKDEVDYFTAVLKNGAADNNKLLSLESNMIVTKILDAARRSAREGKKIFLK
ncbi:MAG: Gfo/Idh/MocA family oxidoreductase [Ferruginibacter sp.]